MAAAAHPKEGGALGVSASRRASTLSICRPPSSRASSTCPPRRLEILLEAEGKKIGAALAGASAVSSSASSVGSLMDVDPKAFDDVFDELGKMETIATQLSTSASQADVDGELGTPQLHKRCPVLSRALLKCTTAAEPPRLLARTVGATPLTVPPMRLRPPPAQLRSVQPNNKIPPRAAR